MSRANTKPIDLDFRPSTYFWPLGLEKHLLARIKGAERRAALKRLIADGRIDEIPAFLSQSALSEADRKAIGRIHPNFLGGEFLPDLREQEVAIARITIASVTQDVVCVYARRENDSIHYRVVDEYEGDTLSEPTTCTSTQPLTLGELQQFLDGAWSIFDVLEMNFGDDGYDLDQMLGFIVGVDSEFYPQIGALYLQEITRWAAEKRSEFGFDENEEEDDDEDEDDDVEDPDSPDRDSL